MCRNAVYGRCKEAQCESEVSDSTRGLDVNSTKKELPIFLDMTVDEAIGIIQKTNQN
jgi:hypothetical protein